MNTSLSVSVIVTTYNWPEALEGVIRCLSRQCYKGPIEIIVADDGSHDHTSQEIRALREACPFPLIHCWQPDVGFRAAMIRNRAVGLARHDYLVFMDGDCLVNTDFIARHVALAQAGWFVSGNRVLLSQAFTQQVLSEKLEVEHWNLFQWFLARLSGKANRFIPHLPLPLGGVRKIAASKWKGAKTCNLSLFRKDFISVNGMDEAFTGWGFEDSDLVIRLQKQGINRKIGQCAIPVYHLWHKVAKRDNVEHNQSLLANTLKKTENRSQAGVDQYQEHGHYYASKPHAL